MHVPDQITDRTENTDMTSYTDTDLTAVILSVLRDARRTLSDADLARDIEQAVRDHLAIECADGHLIAPEVTAASTEQGAWSVDVDGESVTTVA